MTTSFISPATAVARFPIGGHVQHAATGQLGTVVPCGPDTTTPGYAYGRILHFCAWINVRWDNGCTEGVVPSDITPVPRGGR